MMKGVDLGIIIIIIDIKNRNKNSSDQALAQEGENRKHRESHCAKDAILASINLREKASVTTVSLSLKPLVDL